LGLLAALVTAAPCSCARPIVYQLSLQQPRSSSAIALVLASSGAGSERIDVTTVDDRGIRDYFGDVPVWIELPPGPHFFWVGLLWTRGSSGGAFIGLPAQATLEAGKCYRPMLAPSSQPLNWRNRPARMERTSCSATWLSFPRRIEQASPAPVPM